MRSLIFFGLLILPHFYSLAQKSYEHGIPYYPIPVQGHSYIDVQYLEINKNNFLLKEIRAYIKEQTDSCNLFKSGFGFIRVDNINVSSNLPSFVTNGDNNEHIEQVRFRMGINSYLLTQSFVTLSGYCTGCFPDLYSIVDGRLVLFYSNQANWLHQGYFSEDSKARLIALQKDYLKQALDPSFVYTDLFGKTFQLTIQERSRLTEQEILIKASLTLQKNKTVIQYLDGRVEYKY